MASSSSLGGQTTVEILQHWAEEGTDPMETLIEEFERAHGDVRFENDSEHVSSLRLVVKSQILKEEPPDLWVEWPGKNIELGVESGVIGDVSDLWQTAGLAETFVDGAAAAARFDGTYRCVPTDIYRINNLYFNREMVDRAGVDPETVGKPEGFLSMLESLDDALDVAPIVINGKDPFGPLQLWESFVIAHGGASTYEDLLEGTAGRHRDAVGRAVESLNRTLEYAHPEITFLASSESDDAFVAGEAALSHNGGWAVGRMKGADGFDYGTDWGYAPFPGTGDAVQMNMNALVPAAGSADDATVRAFMEHVAQPSSLATIADAVGGIPPRGDVAVDALHPVTQEHHRSLDGARHQLHSMAHGLGVRPDTLIGLKSDIASFMQDRDVEATTAAIVDTLSTTR